MLRSTPKSQVVVLLVAISLVLLGRGTIHTTEIIRPAQAADVPVIIPFEPKVESEATVAPRINCAKVACLALTFDDGPDPVTTPQVLDILSRYNAKATFFLIGLRVAGNEGLIRRMHQEGHEIGNHTWSHRDLSKLSPQEIEADIAQAQNAITAAGVPAPRLFRPPYGAVDAMVRSHVPMSVISWNIDPEDWKARKSQKIVDHVLAHAKPGAIVDLHDIHPVTVESLDSMLAQLSQNYYLVTVDDLLGLPAGQPGIFYGR